MTKDINFIELSPEETVRDIICKAMEEEFPEFFDFDDEDPENPMLVRLMHAASVAQENLADHIVGDDLDDIE